MNPKLKELIDQGFHRSKKQMITVGFLLFLFSCFMVSLFWLDSSMKNSGFPLKIAFGLLVGLFFSVSVMLLYVPLIKNPNQKKKLLSSLEQHPNDIKKVHSYVVYARIAENQGVNPPGSQHYIQITFQNESIIQLAYPYEKISEVLDLFHKQVPHAF